VGDKRLTDLALKRRSASRGEKMNRSRKTARMDAYKYCRGGQGRSWVAALL